MSAANSSLTLVAEPVFEAMTSEPEADAAAPEERDPWRSQDPWARWRSETAEMTNEASTTPTDDTTAAELNDDHHHSGATVDDSGRGDRSGSGGGAPGAYERPRWSWLQGTWKPEFGGKVNGNWSWDDRRACSRASATSTSWCSSSRPPSFWIGR